MAKKNEKSKYQGPKLVGDTREYRDAALKRAQKNSAGAEVTNAIFAIQDEPFKKACEEAGVQATPRQASKFRNKYGKAARTAGVNVRRDPEIRNA